MFNKYPYKSDHSNIYGHSVDTSDCIRINIIKKLFEIVRDAENNIPKTQVCHAHIQSILHIYAHCVNYKRIIAINRIDGTPMLIEVNKTDNCLYAAPLSYNHYQNIITELIDLLEVPHVRYAVDIYACHGYSMENLLNITSDSWHKYILPAKEYNVTISESDTTLHPATIEDLSSDSRLRGVHKGKICTIINPVGEYYTDYIVTVSYDGSDEALIDIRELSDIYERIFYIEVKGETFKVQLTGINEVMIEATPFNRRYIDYGFRWMDPRDFGPGWDVNKSLIDSVKVKNQSVFKKILNSLK